MTTALSNARRLQKLEDEIRQDAGQVEQAAVRIGLRLIEIRDCELWKPAYSSWDQYLKTRAKELIQKSFSQAARLIRAAEVSRKLPENLSSSDGTELRTGHLDELARLAPNVGQGNGLGVQKDYSRIDRKAVERVLKEAKSAAGDKPPSVADVHDAVDKELGIDRAAASRAGKEAAEKTRYESDHPVLHEWLRSMTGRLEAQVERLEDENDLNDDAWKQLCISYPATVEGFIEVADRVAELRKKAARFMAERHKR
jgi:hypothetical protein